MVRRWLVDETLVYAHDRLIAMVHSKGVARGEQGAWEVLDSQPGADSPFSSA